MKYVCFHCGHIELAGVAQDTPVKACLLCGSPAIDTSAPKPEPAPRPKRIFVCTPYSADIENNTFRALAICRRLALQGHIPIAPHLYAPRFLYEHRAIERQLGIGIGLELLKVCDELWCYDGGKPPSAGMRQELEAARRLGIPIKMR